MNIEKSEVIRHFEWSTQSAIVQSLVELEGRNSGEFPLEGERFKGARISGVFLRRYSSKATRAWPMLTRSFSKSDWYLEPSQSDQIWLFYCKLYQIWSHFTFSLKFLDFAMKGRDLDLHFVPRALEWPLKNVFSWNLVTLQSDSISSRHFINSFCQISDLNSVWTDFLIRRSSSIRRFSSAPSSLSHPSLRPRTWGQKEDKMLQLKQVGCKEVEMSC